ncbi:MAG: hypothetical protein HRT54_18135 [Colwellia sp.]|nr:hypothetical protein [Colwellia sp.]
MKNNDESFLTSLLQYHTRLIDQQFVDNIMNNLKASNKFRLRIMIIALLLACSLTVTLLFNMSEELAFLNTLSSMSPYMMTFCLITALGFVTWLTSDNF